MGCLEESLTFPNFQTGFHIKGYRRVNLWGKDRPWTDTGLQVEKGDRIYFYGTGEVTTCPHSSCNVRGPRNLNERSLSYKVSKQSSPVNLNRFDKIDFESDGFKRLLPVHSSGTLYLTVPDWSTYPPPNEWYDDNSGVYILDIFVMNPGQEEGFKRFKDSLFEANPDDANVKACLGKR